MTDTRELIAAMRRARGISRYELAERLGVAPAAVFTYERGRTQPKLVTVEAVAKALGFAVQLVVSPDPFKSLRGVE